MCAPERCPPYDSSPLTRGKRAGNRVGKLVPGLIPAHAGKTSHAGPCPATRRAHPRSRGENIASSFAFASSLGSSPLTRGKHLRRSDRRDRRRLIPAHAGKTLLGCLRFGGSGAHPRSRGENMTIKATAGPEVGSSPLTRGKRALPHRHRERPGLIPAHAGKTPPSPRHQDPRTAHPRSRGENNAHMEVNAVEQGSSPLTRGKPARRSARLFAHRLIPAHAGKTTCPPASSAATSAHPRSRGENGQA